MPEVTVAVSTPRQLDSIKSTTVGKTYELSLTKDYVSKWGIVEAIRELIQNALDSQSPFVYSWVKEEDAWTLVLQSELTTLPPQTLLLGATTKRDSDDTIGSFGEGYKLALLVLTREGIDIDMFNGEVLWRPRFRHSRTFGDELLVIDESFLLDKSNRGLTFRVYGLSEQDKQAVVESCIRMQSDIGAIKQTKFGDILLDKKGKLFVGGLFICDMEMHYGYNIHPKHIRLERDRKTVDGYDLSALTAKMWFDIGEPDRVAKMIHDNVPDVKHAQYDSPEIIKEECYRIFRQTYPDALLADSPEEARKAIEEGLVKKVYIGGGWTPYHAAVSSSPSYRNDLRSPSYFVAKKEAPQAALETFLQAWEKSMSKKCRTAFQELITRAKNWKGD